MTYESELWTMRNEFTKYFGCDAGGRRFDDDCKLAEKFVQRFGFKDALDVRRVADKYGHKMTQLEIDEHDRIARGENAGGNAPAPRENARGDAQAPREKEVAE